MRKPPPLNVEGKNENSQHTPPSHGRMCNLRREKAEQKPETDQQNNAETLSKHFCGMKRSVTNILSVVYDTKLGKNWETSNTERGKKKERLPK